MGLIAPIIMGGAPFQVLLTVSPRDEEKTKQIFILINIIKCISVFPIIMGGAPSQVLLTVSPGEDEEKIKNIQRTTDIHKRMSSIEPDIM